MLCIFSLPGESASRARVVRRPYATAHAAQTRATTTPWFVRKLLKKSSAVSWRAARGSRALLSTVPPGSLSRAPLPAEKRGAVYRAVRREAFRALDHTGPAPFGNDAPPLGTEAQRPPAVRLRPPRADALKRSRRYVSAPAPTAGRSTPRA